MESSVGIKGYLSNIDEDDSLVQEKIKEMNRAIKMLGSMEYNIFYFGAQYGYEIIMAEIITEYKNKMWEEDIIIKTIAVVPYEGEADYWQDTWRDRYFNLLSQCDEVVTLNTRFKKGCYKEKNIYIEEHSKLILNFEDGAVQYQKDPRRLSPKGK